VSSDPAFRNADGTVDEERAGIRRAELFTVIEDLVKWENSNNPKVINAARAEIAASVASRKVELGELQKDTIVFGKDEGKPHPDGPMAEDGTTAWRVMLRRSKPEVVNNFLATYAPPVLDPFAGGGSIPLEAQRLGLRAHASDLNPVAVLINKALIEIPSKFADQPPLHPEAEKKTGWSGAAGLAEDVRLYGQWVREEAERRIGHLYPKVAITKRLTDVREDLASYIGQELEVIGWLWARTVPSPSPAFRGSRCPLPTTHLVSKKKGNEAWVEAINDRDSIVFRVHAGTPPKSATPGAKIGRGRYQCLLSKTPIEPSYIKEVGHKQQIGTQLLAVVANGARERVYLSPDCTVVPEVERGDLFSNINTPPISGYFNPWVYGYDTVNSLFTDRQLRAIETFADLIAEVVSRVESDGGDSARGRAIAVYLSLTLALDVGGRSGVRYCTIRIDFDELHLPRHDSFLSAH